MGSDVLFSPIPLLELEKSIKRIIEGCLKEDQKIISTNSIQKYLRQDEAAELLGISRVTLRKYTLEGKINGHRVGARVLYGIDDLQALITKGNTGRFRQ